MVDVEDNSKLVFKVSVDSPGAPAYYVYKRKIAEDLKRRLDKEYGSEFTITLKEHIIHSSAQN